MEEMELAYFKAHLGQLSQAALRQLKADIISERRMRETVALVWQTTHWPEQWVPNRLRLGGGGAPAYHKAPRVTACKRKANELDSSDSLEPAGSTPRQ